MMETNLKHAQEDELRALSSIYINALKDLRSKRDKRLRPPYFSLTITPLRSNSTAEVQQNTDPSFELIVQETSQYPNELPEIKLLTPKNLPIDALERCEKELRIQMQSYIGEEMIYLLAQYAQTFLDEFRPRKRTPPIIPPPIEPNPENDKDQQIEREIDAIRERYSKEAEKQRHRQADVTTTKHVKFARIASETILKFENPIEITVRRGHMLHKEIHPLIPEEILNTSYICTDSDSAHIYCLYEWNFDNISNDDKITDQEDFRAQYRREIGNIENDIKRLINMRHHLLCKIVAYQYVIHDTATYTFRVLTEWPEASSLEVFDSCPVSESLLKKIAIALCEILSFLHSKSIVHRAINTKSVYLCTTGVKLTRTNFLRRLNDLHILFHEGQLPRSLHGTPKNDIYDMGLLLLNLAAGRTHECILDAPSTLSDEFRDFLQRCANGDSLKQLSVDPFLVHTSESQKNFDRLISDSDTRDTSSTNNNNEEMLVSAQSRLKSDFEVIGIIGRGGFGHVFKVQNKLDGCFYAVKQILLKSANKHVNKKITREVKLLSKLNHQNIVRYYSTWTEQMPLRNENKSSTDPSLTNKSRTSSKKKPSNGDSLRNELQGIIPDLSSSNGQKNVENHASSSTSSSSSSTPSSDDESGVFDTRTFHPVEKSDDGFVFDHDENNVDKSENPTNGNKKDQSSSSSSVNSTNDQQIQRVLFIQMEYCEGNTLKQLIDRGILQEKPNMIWMLLREILDGLRHMHIKGIIHRDLKPGNILLDSNGHAKIGDLGLATISKLSGYSDSSAQVQENSKIRSSWSVELKDGGLISTPVGTTFYIAPELLSGQRIAPTEKVDIFSLGITFFEMCYPFNTSMERAKTLCELRRPEIHVPDHFRQKTFSRHYEIIMQMLNHEPDKRPTANILLESNIIPFEQEEQFEQLLDRMINSTNNDLQSFYYRKTITKLFQRKNTIARDATFDPDTQIDFNKLAIFHRDSQIYTNLRNSFIRVCEKYGAFFMRLPLFIPETLIYNKNECANLKFLSSTGLIVSLAFDSKVPLARFIARCVSHYGLNGLTTMKCYQIGNVYREGVTEMHPRELTECGFDIIFTQSTFLPDAEILAFSQDVLEEVHLLKKRNVIIRLNHSQLLRAILIFFDIPTDKISSLLAAINKSRYGATIAMHLIENGISEQTANRIQTLLDKDGLFDDIINHLKGFTRAKTEGSKLLKNIVDELETIVKSARDFGVTMPIHLTLRFVTLNPILDINTFSGFIFQLASVVQRKKRTVYEVYGGGGRYDPLLANFRRPSQKNLSNDLPHIVGVSFDMERFIQLSTTRTTSPTRSSNNTKVCDTVICLGNHLEELLRLRHELVTMGIGVDTFYELPSNFEILDDYCLSCGYTHLIYGREDSSDGGFRFRNYENGKVITDKRLFIGQIIQHYREDNNNTNLINTNNNGASSNVFNDTEQSLAQPTVGTPGGFPIKNAPSIPSLNQNNEPISSGAQLNIYLYLTEAMHKSIPKKKIENQVQYKLSTVASLFTSKSRIEVFVFDIPDSILTLIISTLVIEDEVSYDTSARTIMEKIPTRFHDTIDRFFDQLKDLRFLKKTKLFVISSYKTDFYRFMAAFT